MSGLILSWHPNGAGDCSCCGVNTSLMRCDSYLGPGAGKLQLLEGKTRICVNCAATIEIQLQDLHGQHKRDGKQDSEEDGLGAGADSGQGRAEISKAKS